MSYSQVTPSFWLCMCINFSLFCTHFLCHWRKIHNVWHWLTQISKRQCDPCRLFPVHSQSASTHVCSTMATNIVNKTNKCDVPQKENFCIQNVFKKNGFRGFAPPDPRIMGGGQSPHPKPTPSKLFSFLPSHSHIPANSEYIETLKFKQALTTWA